MPDPVHPCEVPAREAQHQPERTLSALTSGEAKINSPEEVRDGALRANDSPSYAHTTGKTTLPPCAADIIPAHLAGPYALRCSTPDHSTLSPRLDVLTDRHRRRHQHLLTHLMAEPLTSSGRLR
ncbi:hypothetical protein AB0I49_14545 [Streptomyces sp. NPDC050617]|uniref:hypothetical protein n=1 Tax=Streptomyces sp. NPDC050617 TaxID=3154628 RepID=UPI0034448090